MPTNGLRVPAMQGWPYLLATNGGPTGQRHTTAPQVGREAWGPILSSLFRERNTPTSRGLCQVEQRPSMQAISLPRTSHNTYNKYREPLFHFGCISTTNKRAMQGSGRTR